MVSSDTSSPSTPRHHPHGLAMTTPSTSSHASVQILRLAQVCRMTGLCRSSVYNLEAQNRFPKRIHLTTHAVGWVEGEVQTWLAERIAGSRTHANSSSA